MALFKILKGKNRDLAYQAKTDGWAWFTPDTGSFYIDALNDTTNEIDRIEINPKSTTINATIFSSSNSLWDLDNRLYPIVDSQIKNNHNGFIDINSDDFTVVSEATKANFKVSSVSNGQVVIQAKGTVPTINIPITIVLVPTEKV